MEIQANDASPAVVRFLRNRAVGLFLVDLLSTNNAFDRLLRESNDKNELIKSAGRFLPDRVRDDEFVAALAKELTDSLQSILWVKLLQHLTSTTSCKFTNLGRFYRWENKLSFASAVLVNQDTRPEAYAASDSVEAVIDSLCRRMLGPLWNIAQSRLKDPTTATISTLSESLLREMLTDMFTTINPPKPEAVSLLSTATAFSTYYTWTLAFATAIRRAPIVVSGVGSFELVSETPIFNIRFNAETTFQDLVDAKISADEGGDVDVTSPRAAA